MKVFLRNNLILLLVASMTSAVQQNSPTIPDYSTTPVHHPQCPQVDDELHSILLPYPTDCRRYYSCLNGMAYAMICPDNLHWSSLTYRCDYPEVATCQQISNDPVIPTPIAQPLPNILEYRLFSGDCNKFYQCQVMYCPNNFHWNNNLQRCDFPHMAACAQQPTDSTGITPVTTPSTITPPTAATPPTTPTYPTSTDMGPTTQDELDQLCSTAGQKYIHYPGDCHRFIQCNGIAFVHKCPANLFWNSILTTCDRYCK